MIDHTRYPVEVRPLSPEDGGGWLAVFPDLPGCMGDGETPQDAVADGYEAAKAWLEVAHECGDPVPAPPAAAANPGVSWRAFPEACTPALPRERRKRE